jgi:hypothetical protein
MTTIDRLLDSIPIPRIVKVRQWFERPKIDDVESELCSRLRERGVLSKVKENQRIAITVGSRGISNQPLLVKTLVEEIKKAGGDPFLIPAMGSHGGATAEGQRDMLIGMGFEESYIGAPIRATMEVVQIGTSEDNLPVCIDRYAHEADGIVVINRIKPHVAFRGKYESGLVKMITIGLGKQKGADICHDLGFGQMEKNLLAIARITLKEANILFAIGLLENAYHETCRIEVLLADEIEREEPALQEESKRLMPRLPFDSLDVLIIDEIGKDISGTGFDTNIVGRYHTPYASGGPNITRIAALDVTDISHGNASGLGILDFTTQRAFEKFVFEQTYPNSLTSTVPTTVKIPMVLKNDRQTIQAAIKTCNILKKEEVRLVRIKNTLSLGEIEVSDTLLNEVKGRSDLEIQGELYSFGFDKEGNLI